MARVWITFNFRVVRSRRRAIIRCKTSDLIRNWETGYAQVEIIREQLRQAARDSSRHELTFSSIAQVEEAFDRLKFIGCVLQVTTGAFESARSPERIADFVNMMREEFMIVARYESACGNGFYELCAMLEDR